MNLKMTVVQISIEGGHMTDWIDDLKEKDERAKANEVRKEEIRLNKDKVISAKLPEFWKDLIEEIDRQCAKLTETFSSNERRQLHRKNSSHEGFIILRGKYAVSQLTVIPNFNGQFINVIEGGTGDIYDLTPSGRRMKITADVNNNNDLELWYEGAKYTTAAQLAEALLAPLTE